MNHELVRDVLIDIGRQICDQVHFALIHQSLEERTSVHVETQEDTIYSIDKDVESIIIPELNKVAESLGGIVLIAEGVGEHDVVVIPEGISEQDARLRILMDPIDGTRCIMYDKRSAFYLAGAAPNLGKTTSLADIEVAVMVELPTSRSVLSDMIWAIAGQGTQGITRNLANEDILPLSFHPSQSETILGGFAQISRFFPPGKEILSKIEDELVHSICPNPPTERAILFEDQYISTGGQLYEMLLGHDRFTADLRACLYHRLQKEGHWIGLTCHPYDVCAHLIGTEAGIIITNEKGEPLNPPMNTTAPINWIAYANASIQDEVEPVLLDLLRQHGLLEANDKPMRS